MPRIAGVDLKEHKNIEIALSYIYGIGRPTALKILALTKISPLVKVKDLSESQVNTLRKTIEERASVEGVLRQRIREDIKRLKEIRSYRGMRHEKRLPVRGQQTRTNSRTVRGNVRHTAAGTSAKKSQPTPT
ncbi:MAG: 30S ribosomal protein S13 [Candidatus Portnoybacteria bacterium]|nr:30S ribosomal protein S13 [Candidatus Portnoybacteria bacterium]